MSKRSHLNFRSNSWLYFGIVVFIILLFELILQALDYQPKILGYFWGFEQNEIKLFDNQAGQIKLLDSHKRWFHPFQYTPDTRSKLVVSMGDSITWGDPGPESKENIKSYSDHLSSLFSHHQNIKMINLGAKTFSSSRMSLVFDQVLKLNPKLIIMSIGTSEFLEYRAQNQYQKMKLLLYLKTPFFIQDHFISRFIDKSKTRESLLKRDRYGEAPFISRDQLFIDKERDLLERNFKSRLNQLVEKAKKHSVALIFLTNIRNLTWPPMASHKKDDQRTMELNKLLTQGNLAGFFHLFQKIEHPEAPHYFLAASASKSLNKEVETLEFYRKAINNDAFPIRMTSNLNSSLALMESLQDHVFTIDVEMLLLNSEHRHRVLSGELYLDHCHPGMELHQLIAEMIFNTIKKHKLIEL